MPPTDPTPEVSGRSAAPPPPPEGISVDIALPCPFCGEYPDFSSDEHSTIIECVERDCVRPSWCDEAGYDGDDEHEKRAIAAWNHRPTASGEAGPSRGAPAPLAPEGIDARDQRTGKEIARFQDAVRSKLCDLLQRLGLRDYIDGSGGDSGDWMDLTRDEVQQACNAIIDAIDEGKVLTSRAPQPLPPEGKETVEVLEDGSCPECGGDIMARERQQHAETMEKHAAEYHRIATALGCHVHDDLAAKAASREDELARLRAELIHAHNWQKRMCALHDEDTASLGARLDKLAAFKEFVHRRLDEAGVPFDPPGEHREAGCRVGQRLDWLIDKRDAADAAGFARGIEDAAKVAEGGAAYDYAWDPESNEEWPVDRCAEDTAAAIRALAPKAQTPPGAPTPMP